eukprot:Unigene3766_Nuclearia_a/m.11488 Unigene3766_Nuclearia_a/g.11488  ORF Unigene3766_Nuclearia_a/g.11488 Unigene3766_Nuclearia_a/m.11488 type:complete len:104 (-) Unigene3766_Nuclearia_a:232-543(-)
MPAAPLVDNWAERHSSPAIIPHKGRRDLGDVDLKAFFGFSNFSPPRLLLQKEARKVSIALHIGSAAAEGRIAAARARTAFRNQAVELQLAPRARRGDLCSSPP